MQLAERDQGIGDVRMSWAALPLQNSQGLLARVQRLTGATGGLPLDCDVMQAHRLVDHPLVHFNARYRASTSLWFSDAPRAFTPVRTTSASILSCGCAS